MPNLIITKDSNSDDAKYRWNWCYLHGKIEEDFNQGEQITPDIFYCNKDEPTFEGEFIAYINNKTVLINTVLDENNIMRGRACYLDDFKALKHVLSPQNWA